MLGLCVWVPWCDELHREGLGVQYSVEAAVSALAVSS